MSNYFITDTTLTSIANAIRSKTHTSEQILVKDFASKIGELGSGLPELANPATAEEVFSGYQFIGSDGAAETGSFTIESELNEQVELLTQITNALSVKILNSAFLYLYNHGDECIDASGGWEAYAYKTSTSGSTVLKPTVTKNTDFMKMSVTSSDTSYKAGCIMSKQAIDVTNFNTLKLCARAISGSTHLSISVTYTKENNYIVEANA